MKPRLGIPLFLIASAAVSQAQAVCFATVGEALAGRGTPTGNGFRRRTTMEDPLNGRRWATVERCEHPEWPPLLVADPEAELAIVAKVRNLTAPSISPAQVLVASGAVASGAVAATATVKQPAVRAGETVTVVERTPLMRLEVEGVALNSARTGEAVRVRVGREGANHPQVVAGLVRGRDLVELEDNLVEQQ